jgi:2'-5' RNA ligase
VTLPQLTAHEAGPYRYGIFLRPSPELARVSLRAYEVVTRQFGLNAAAKYPPHVTVIGSIALSGTEADLTDTIDKVMAGQRPITVHNAGLIAKIGFAVGYELNYLPDGFPNLALRELYESMRTATAGARAHVSTDRQADKRLANEAAESFKAHLTVVGHDAADNPELLPEIKRFLGALPEVQAPAEDTLDTVSLFRFTSADWPGRYWESMSWTLLRSWPMAPHP